MDVRAKRQMAAPVERVVRALTDPVALTRWCCEAVDLTPEACRLMGRGIPGGAMGGPLGRCEGGSVQFQWPLRGRLSSVAVTVTPAPADGAGASAAAVAVAHTEIPDGALPGARWEQGSWTAYWQLMLRLLQGWVEWGEILPPFDFEVGLTGVTERAMAMPAPPDQVWDALMRPVRRGRFQLAGPGSVLTHQEPHRTAVFQWQQYRSCRVTVNLEPLPGAQTQVRLTEETLPDGGLDHHLGWHLFLVDLLLEVGPAPR